MYSQLGLDDGSKRQEEEHHEVHGSCMGQKMLNTTSGLRWILENGDRIF